MEHKDLPPPYSEDSPKVGFGTQHPPPPASAHAQVPGVQYPPPPTSAPAPAPVPGAQGMYGFGTQYPQPPAHAQVPGAQGMYGPPQVISPQPAVIVLSTNTCATCRVGIIKEDYTFLGILLAVLCFPWGLLCCLLMKEKRCNNCDQEY